MRTTGSTSAARVVAIGVCLLAVAAASGTVRAPAWATPAIALRFVPHGAFFSRETHQKVAIDPQVFVKASGVTAGVGPQNIRHVAGFAPARLSDPPSTPLFNADGQPLDITLGRWLGARGTATIEAARSGGARVAASFSGLIPRGTYSLFRVTFRPGGNTFTPLDGTGASNSFTAGTTGTAGVTVRAPTPLTHANAVLLVYHSDGRTHGTSRGAPGVTAHHQLIARIP
jgi:hypothetical protein